MRQVKSGAAINEVCPQPSDEYFIPDVEQYFKGKDRLKRKRGLLNDPVDDVKFFVTEGKKSSDYQSMPQSNRTKSRAMSQDNLRKQAMGSGPYSTNVHTQHQSRPDPDSVSEKHNIENFSMNS